MGTNKSVIHDPEIDRKLAQEAVIMMAELRRRIEQNYEPDTGFPWAERIEEDAIRLGLVRKNSIGNIEATDQPEPGKGE